MAKKKEKENLEINEDENMKESAEAEQEEAAEEKDPQDEALEKAVRERDDYLDMLKRERADFENYKKRNASLSSTSFLNGSIDIIDKILPVMDNFERALADVEGSDDSFAKGINMIYRQLADALKSAGVMEIDALGKEFDPEIMNAVMQVECGEGEDPGTVCEVLQKGYKIQDKILRHAMVKVTK